MSRRRQLVSRMRTAFFGSTPPAPTPVGTVWSPAVAAAWADVPEQVDAMLKRPGTAAVSTWEVCAADLARVLIGEPGERALIERFSDALVPTLEALQGPHKQLPTAAAEGRTAGEAVGTLAAATRPLVLLPSGLDAALGAGWAKTAAFLDPVVAGARDPQGAAAALHAAGPRLAEGARAAEALLRERLARLPQADDPLEGIVEPFEAWAEALGRTLEVELHGAAHRLIRSLR